MRTRAGFLGLPVLGPGRPEGHYWLGVDYGVYGQAKGVLSGLSLVGSIKDEMNKELAIDPSYDDGGPDRALGRMYYELPGIFGSGKQKSLEQLLKSERMGPCVGLTRIYLADTYLALKDVAKARQDLEFVIDTEPGLQPNPEAAREKQMAREKLESKEFQVK